MLPLLYTWYNIGNAFFLLQPLACEALTSYYKDVRHTLDPAIVQTDINT